MNNCLAGLVTHKPFSTLSWLLKTNIDVDILMLPINKMGMFMDSSSNKISSLIMRIGKPVIGKKVLAAGHLHPREALTYVAKLGCVDVVALGIASEKEAEETFRAAAEAFLER